MTPWSTRTGCSPSAVPETPVSDAGRGCSADADRLSGLSSGERLASRARVVFKGRFQRGRRERPGRDGRGADRRGRTEHDDEHLWVGSAHVPGPHQRPGGRGPRSRSTSPVAPAATASRDGRRSACAPTHQGHGRAPPTAKRSPPEVRGVTGRRPEVRRAPIVAGLPSRSWCAQCTVVRRVADTSRTTIIKDAPAGG